MKDALTKDLLSLKEAIEGIDRELNEYANPYLDEAMALHLVKKCVKTHMNKYLTIILLFTLLTFPLSAGWIEPIMKVEFGYLLGDQLELVIDQGHYVFIDVYPEGTINLDITVGAELFTFLWLEGEFITYMTFLDANPIGGMFSPYQMEYGFRAGIQRWGIRIGYEHWCFHPVSVFGEYPVRRYGGSDRVFIQFDIQRLNQ